jgi:hypothetical protein
MPVTGELDGIKAIIQQTTGLTGDFVDDVDLRLQSFGYTVQDSDAWPVAFAIQKVANSIKNACNRTAIPDGLMKVVVDMVCGEFLFVKKGSGQLEGFNVDLNAAGLKQVQEGDTNIVFAMESIASPEQRLNALINFLMTNGKNEFIAYRRLAWN